MSEIERKISEQYQHGNLIEAIEKGLQQLGSAPEKTNVDELAPVDEFHIGGRAASAHFLAQLGINPQHKLLDLGCGLGGGARFVAHNFGASVVGVDLNQEYVEAGQTMNEWVGLKDQIDLRFGDVSSLPFRDSSFDGAYMMHVGMNIEDKQSMFAEVRRVLKPEGKFGIYDVTKTNSEELVYPVPWANSSATSWLASASEYRDELSTAGFQILSENDRLSFALEFFKKMKEAAAANAGPPPLGLHVLMRQSTAEKVPNMIANLMAGRISPMEMICQKAN